MSDETEGPTAFTFSTRIHEAMPNRYMTPIKIYLWPVIANLAVDQAILSLR